ncbi:polysaccharide deacetylase family protein [Streptococcus oricebi]
MLVCSLFIFLGCLAWGIFRFLDWRAEQELKQEITSSLQQMDQKHNKGEVERKETKKGQSLIVAYYPRLNGQVISAIADQMDADWKNANQGQDQKPLKRLLFYTSQTSSTSLAGIDLVELEKSERTVLDHQLSPVKNLQLGHLYLRKNGEVLTLNQLFKDSEGAKQVFLASIEEGLLAQGQAESDSQNLVEELAKQDLSQWKFRYEEGLFKIFLPTNKTKLGESVLPLGKFYDLIDESYLKDEDLKAYQQYQANKKKKLVALTFDDGPDPKTTPQALDILAKYKAKATFFMLGQHIAGNENLIKRVQKEGHEIGNHTWSHPRLPTLSLAQAQKEIEDTQAALAAVTGQRPRLLRPPYGEFTGALCAGIDLSFILWSVDSLDWQSHKTEAILDQVKKQVKEGSIILMHDIHQTSIDALPTVLDYLQKNGYSLVTVSELMNQQLEGHQVYYNAP